MKKELEQQLVKKYPNLYRDYGGNPRHTCMAWGFSCGDGWYGIIDRLSAKLEPLNIVALQVKEKFGLLRYYIGNGNDEAYEYIYEAEAESSTTCEVCGKEGFLKNDTGWLSTLCNECREKLNNNEIQTWGIK